MNEITETPKKHGVRRVLLGAGAAAGLAVAAAVAPLAAAPASAGSFNCSSTITDVSVGSYEDGRQVGVTLSYHCPDMIVGDYVILGASVAINGEQADLLPNGANEVFTPKTQTKQCVLPRDLGTGTHDLNCTISIAAAAPAGTNTYTVTTSDLLTGIHTDPYEPLNTSGTYVR